MRAALLPLSTLLLASLIAPAAWSEPTRPTSGFLDSTVASTPSGTLSLEDALTRAQDASPALAAARNEAAASEGLLNQAGVIPNPTLSVDVEDRKAATRTTTTALSVPLELGGKRAARMQAATLSRDIAQHAYATTRSDLRAAVIAAYFQAAIAQEKLRVARNTGDIAEQALRLAQRRVDAGKTAPLESNRAQVERANAALNVRMAQQELDTARRSLSLLWGTAQPAFSDVAAPLEALPARGTLDDLRAAMAQSPAMQAARLSVELGRAQLEVEKSKRYPDITLSAGMQRDNEAGRNIAQLGVEIPLPLFDRNQGNVYAATMQSYKAQDQYRDNVARQESALLQAVSQFDLGADAIKQYRTTVLPNARQAYESARKGFEAGKFGFLDVLDAQRTLSQGNIDYLTVLSSFYQASADIDRLTGR